MRHLFEMFGNPKAVQAAIEKAVPNLEKIRDYHKRIERNQELLEQIDKGRDKVVNLSLAERISDKEAEQKLDELNQKKEKIQGEIIRLSDYLQSTPDPKNVKSVAKNISSSFNVKRRAITKTINSNFEGMTFEQKRALVESVFSGKTVEGKRMGVYLYWNEDGWTFDIKGQLIDESGLRPLTDSQKDVYWGDFQGAGQKQISLTKNAYPLPDIGSP